MPEDGEDAKAVRNQLIDAVRTTRKYGLGWMFISQTLSSLHQEILQQLRISFFGFGLGLGTDVVYVLDPGGGPGVSKRCGAGLTSSNTRAYPSIDRDPAYPVS